MRAWIIWAVAFAVLFFAALWVGSWAFNRYHGTWAEFPAFFTAAVLCVGSALGGFSFMFALAMKMYDRGVGVNDVVDHLRPYCRHVARMSERRVG